MIEEVQRAKDAGDIVNMICKNSIMYNKVTNGNIVVVKRYIYDEPSRRLKEHGDPMYGFGN
jgi:hypothetical protein